MSWQWNSLFVVYHVTIVLFISRAVAYHYFEQVTKAAVFTVLQYNCNVYLHLETSFHLIDCTTPLHTHTLTHTLHTLFAHSALSLTNQTCSSISFSCRGGMPSTTSSTNAACNNNCSSNSGFCIGPYPANRCTDCGNSVCCLQEAK